LFDLEEFKKWLTNRLNHHRLAAFGDSNQDVRAAEASEILQAIEHFQTPKESERQPSCGVCGDWGAPAGCARCGLCCMGG
jgi:hypothetical protein